MNIKNLMDLENPKKVLLNELKPYPSNPRKQNPKAMEFLRKSVQRLGNFRPLLVNHNNEILAGNQLFSVLKEMGISDAICIYPKTTLTKEEEKEIVVADNQNSFHKSANLFDMDLFANEFDFILDEYNLDVSDINYKLGLEEEIKEKQQKDLSDKIINKMCLEIECSSEAEQEILYNRFLGEGLKVKIINL